MALSLEKTLPKNTVISKKGATADIIKQEYPDRTVALKKSKRSDFDSLLQREYITLLYLGSGKNCPESIPQVYDDFSSRGSADVYSFQEEFFDGYRALFDRDNEGHANDALQELTEFERIIVLDYMRQALEYANIEGFSNGDVQIDNTMVKGRHGELRVKVVDWANAEKIDTGNQLRDIKQLAEALPELFDYKLPSGIAGWLNKVETGRITSMVEGWDQLHQATHEYLINS